MGYYEEEVNMNLPPWTNTDSNEDRSTITLQLSSVACQPHVTVIHADLNGIPVTGFVALFESQLNQQLQPQQSGLPTGFIYCMTGVQTQTNEVVLVYSTTPTS